jgi:hypothetical protein
MHRFNVFKAFSGSSRDTSVSIERGSRPHANYGDEVRLGYHALAYGPSRRQVLTKRSRESGQVKLDV